MLIPLTEWAARRYAVPPTIDTLRRWVREGQIHPAPERAGRLYQVDEHAVRIAPSSAPAPRPSLVDRLRAREAA